MHPFTAARVAGVALLALLVAACSTGNEPDASTAADGSGLGDEVATAESTEPEWLFAIQSEGTTTFDASEDRLTVPASTVHAFTDRPYRDTQAITPAAFAGLWRSDRADSFEQDPPNAVLTYWEDESGTGTPRTVVCEVTGDVVDSPLDGTLSMGLRILEPEGASLPQQMFRASLFVDDASTPCANSPQDEMLIEYFNELNFEDEFELLLNEEANLPSADLDEFTIQLTCPPPPSPDIPGPEFAMDLTTGDGTQVTACNSTEPITIDAASLTEQPFCSIDRACSFVMEAANSATGTIYSQTEIEITFTEPSDQSTVIPQLDPATLPICNNILASGSGG